MIINVKSPQPQQMKKFFNLVDRFQKAQNVQIVKANITTFKAVVIAFRPYDSTYIVWDSYYHGEHDRCSYDGFSNGRYDMDLNEAKEVFNKAIN